MQGPEAHIGSYSKYVWDRCSCSYEDETLKVARVKYGPSAVSASPENEDNDRDSSSAHHSIDSIPVVKVTFLER
jgi:hypothetical protein